MMNKGIYIKNKIHDEIVCMHQFNENFRVNFVRGRDVFKFPRRFLIPSIEYANLDFQDNLLDFIFNYTLTSFLANTSIGEIYDCMEEYKRNNIKEYPGRCITYDNGGVKFSVIGNKFSCADFNIYPSNLVIREMFMNFHVFLNILMISITGENFSEEIVSIEEKRKMLFFGDGGL